MDLMQEENEEAYHWLSKIIVKCWARHVVDDNCQTDLVVNSLSEVLNRVILDARGKIVRGSEVSKLRLRLSIRLKEQVQQVICGKSAYLRKEYKMFTWGQDMWL